MPKDKWYKHQYIEMKKKGKTFCKTDILLKDGWLNLKCHKIDMSLVETKEEKTYLKDL